MGKDKAKQKEGGGTPDVLEAELGKEGTRKERQLEGADRKEPKEADQTSGDRGEW